MCGIATITIGRGCRGRVPYPLLRRLCKELLVELTPRGIDASGIAVINDPTGGKESRVFKKALRPECLVKRPMFDKVLEEDIGPATNFIMLHARATTVGDTTNNRNNHPIITPDVDPIVGIHNGTLHNDDQLFKKYEEKFDRAADVDSEIIFRLYRYHVEKGQSPEQAMSLTGEELAGAFTGALVDMRYPHRMVMFKNDRSLCIFRIPHYDIVIAISEARFYDRVSRRLKIRSKDTCHYVNNGTGLLFDLNSGDRITQQVVDFDIPINDTPYYQGASAWVEALVT